jgi:hypothetical protein
VPLCLTLCACDAREQTGNSAAATPANATAAPETAPETPPPSPVAEPTPTEIRDGSSDYVWQVHADAAFYTIPESEWDFAISCKAGDGMLLFMTQNIDEAPPVPHDDFEVGGVRRQLPATFDPEGLGLVSSQISLRDLLVTKLAGGLTTLRIHNAGGETAQISIPAEVAAMIAKCRAGVVRP